MSVLYHVEGNGGASGIAVDLILAGIIGASLPLIIGIFLPKLFKLERYGSVVKGFAVGALFFFLFDLLKEAAGLGEGRITSMLDVLSYALFVTVIILFIISYKGEGGLFSVYLFALTAIGLHSAGEGIILANDFLTGETSITIFQALSYSLHKLAEGIIIGVIIFEATRSIRIDDALTCFVLGFAPFALGLGYSLYNPIGELASLFFAMGAAGVIYGVSYLTSATKLNRITLLGMILGLSFVFFAGVLHSI